MSAFKSGDKGSASALVEDAASTPASWSTPPTTREVGGGKSVEEDRGGLSAMRTLSIVHKETGEVAETIDVTGESDSSVSRLRAGMYANLDIANWKIADSKSEEEA